MAAWASSRSISPIQAVSNSASKMNGGGPENFSTLSAFIVVAEMSVSATWVNWGGKRNRPSR